MSKIGALAACDTSIGSTTSDAEREKAEVLWKVKLNDSKVEAAAEDGTKKMLLTTFNDKYVNKLKHLVKLYTRVTYYTLIQHLRDTYRKLHQLNISELLAKMGNYLDINEGFARYIEKNEKCSKNCHHCRH